MTECVFLCVYVCYDRASVKPSILSSLGFVVRLAVVCVFFLFCFCYFFFCFHPLVHICAREFVLQRNEVKKKTFVDLNITFDDKLAIALHCCYANNLLHISSINNIKIANRS